MASSSGGVSNGQMPDAAGIKKAAKKAGQKQEKLAKQDQDKADVAKNNVATLAAVQDNLAEDSMGHGSKSTTSREQAWQGSCQGA